MQTQTRAFPYLVSDAATAAASSQNSHFLDLRDDWTGES
jgi:hypothetical protein